MARVCRGAEGAKRRERGGGEQEQQCGFIMRVLSHSQDSKGG